MYGFQKGLIDEGIKREKKTKKQQEKEKQPFHSDYKAMKPYIDIADNIKANAMNKFNEL